MPNFIKYPLVLAIIGTISAVSLAGIYSITSPVKKDLAKKQTKEALTWVIEDAEEFVPLSKENPDIYKALKNEKIIGYVSVAESQGYSGPVRVMVGVDTKFKILGTKVLFQSETPGLGDKIIEVLSKKTWGTVIKGKTVDESKLKPYFQVQFEGKESPIEVGKDIEAITGATISSKAFTEAVNKAIKKIQEQI